jgi:hypothetical protein
MMEKKSIKREGERLLGVEDGKWPEIHAADAAASGAGPWLGCMMADEDMDLSRCNRTVRPASL